MYKSGVINNIKDTDESIDLKENEIDKKSIISRVERNSNWSIDCSEIPTWGRLPRTDLPRRSGPRLRKVYGYVYEEILIYNIIISCFGVYKKLP